MYEAIVTPAAHNNFDKVSLYYNGEEIDCAYLQPTRPYGTPEAFGQYESAAVNMIAHSENIAYDPQRDDVAIAAEILWHE